MMEEFVSLSNVLKMHVAPLTGFIMLVSNKGLRVRAATFRVFMFPTNFQEQSSTIGMRFCIHYISAVNSAKKLGGRLYLTIYLVDLLFTENLLF
jgi:hypothetical protein